MWLFTYHTDVCVPSGVCVCVVFVCVCVSYLMQCVGTQLMLAFSRKKSVEIITSGNVVEHKRYYYLF